MKYTTIDVDKIELKDDRFRISYFLPHQGLIESIKTAGLINPPVLSYREKIPVIISGWRRVFACRKLSFKSIPVFISEETDDLEAFKLTVYENLSIRKYSIVEKAEIVKKIKGFGAGEEEIVRKYLPLLDIPPLLKYLHPYLKIAEFELELKKLIHSRNTDFNVLKLMIEFSPPERMLLMPYILPLGKNKQRALVTTIYELSRKEEMSVADILSLPDVGKISEDEKLSSLQKAERLCSLLEAKRNPVLNSWNNAFDKVLKGLNISSGIVVTPSAFYEKEDISLNFSFKNRKEFINKLSELQKIADKNGFSGLFKNPSDD